jgi:hypothetical protein
MSQAVDLDDLQRNLREIASVGEQQISNTVGLVSNSMVDLFETYINRPNQKDQLEVTRKSDSKSPEEVDNIEKNKVKSSFADEQEQNSPIEVERKSSTQPDFLAIKKQGIPEELSTRINDDEPAAGKSSSELIYSFNKKAGSSFKDGINANDAQAILDLTSGVEGTKVNNGENLIIKSKGVTLFETDAEGVIIYSANDRNSNFKNGLNPAFNSVEDLREKARGIIANQKNIKPDLEVSSKSNNPSPQYPDEALLNYGNSSNIAQSQNPGVNDSPEAKKTSQDKAASLVYLKDNLQEGQTQKISDDYSVKAERESSGIVALKMYEIDNPEPVTIGKVNEQGMVVQSKEYTAPRYAAVQQFIKSDKLSRQAPGKAPVAAEQSVVDNRADSKSDIGLKSGNAQQTNEDKSRSDNNPYENDYDKNSPDGKTTGLSNAKGKNNSEETVSRQDLVNLKNYYKDSPEGKALPESEGSGQRFNQGKAALLSSGKASSGDSTLKIAAPYFENYQAQDVALSPEDKGNLPAANEFAEAQSQEQSQKQSAVRKTGKNVAR